MHRTFPNMTMRKERDRRFTLIHEQRSVVRPDDRTFELSCECHAPWTLEEAWVSTRRRGRNVHDKKARANLGSPLEDQFLEQFSKYLAVGARRQELLCFLLFLTLTIGPCSDRRTVDSRPPRSPPPPSSAWDGSASLQPADLF